MCVKIECKSNPISLFGAFRTSQSQAAQQLNVLHPTPWKRQELLTPGSSHKLNRTETQQSVTEVDVINDMRQKFGLEEEVETEDEQETQDAEVTVPTRHKMLKTMETLGKGLLFRNGVSRPCGRSLIVLRSTQPKVKPNSPTLTNSSVQNRGGREGTASITRVMKYIDSTALRMRIKCCYIGVIILLCTHFPSINMKLHFLMQTAPIG